MKRAATLVLAALALGACSRDRAAGPDEPTHAEHAAFSAPADSSLTPQQVDRYLRTTVQQLERLRAEGPAVRERLVAAPGPPAQAQPGQPPAPRPKSRQALWGDFVDAAFVRAARKLGYNPAELWFVRARMSAVSGHLLAAEAQASSGQAAALFRQQAESMRGIPGVTPAQIDAMLQAAERAEQQQTRPTPPRVAQNLEALARARGNLSESAWRRIAGVASGIGVSDLGVLPQPQAEARIDRFLDLYRHAVENREPPPE